MLAQGLLAALIAGCAATKPHSTVQEYLDEDTGTTLTYVAAPVAFVSEQPGLAASGRDYVYLAPIVVSSGGQRSCWLWLGVWSTIDRQARHEDASPLRLGALQIVADDEPIDLDSAAAQSLPASLHHLPYATPVPPVEELLIPVTRSQIRRLGQAQVLVLADAPAGGAARLWQSDALAPAVLKDFSAEAGLATPAPTRVSGQ